MIAKLPCTWLENCQHDRQKAIDMIDLKPLDITTPLSMATCFLPSEWEIEICCQRGGIAIHLINPSCEHEDFRHDDSDSLETKLWLAVHHAITNDSKYEISRLPGGGKVPVDIHQDFRQKE